MTIVKAKAIKGVLLFLAVLGVLDTATIVGVLWPQTNAQTLPISIGFVMGLITGLGFSAYIHKTWDPKLLQPRGVQGSADRSRLMVIAVIGGIVASRITSFLLPEITQLLGIAAVTWSNVVILFMVLQVTRYHLIPRSKYKQ